VAQNVEILGLHRFLVANQMSYSVENAGITEKCLKIVAVKEGNDTHVADETDR